MKNGRGAGVARARERLLPSVKKAYLQGISKFLSSMSDDIMRVHCYQIFNNLKSVPIHAEFSSFPCLTSEHACGSNLECENKRFGFQPATRIECCLPLTREMRHARNCCSLTQLFFLLRTAYPINGSHISRFVNFCKSFGLKTGFFALSSLQRLTLC